MYINKGVLLGVVLALQLVGLVFVGVHVKRLTDFLTMDVVTATSSDGKVEQKNRAFMIDVLIKQWVDGSNKNHGSESNTTK